MQLEVGGFAPINTHIGEHLVSNVGIGTVEVRDRSIGDHPKDREASFAYWASL